ncbi:type I-E CRISPR-associated protein Cas7/Cse4/CasC [Iodidimonas gelatinilytica]|uniref:Type I-E CRISPR-associated protein Cas7/Cse4/CasC n=1 Tax=Iodidimonas gelatinilytica TaxID=1236966 RepID=A0A5A7MSM8_9PROT|nr:type I-E CRISPR-associated protein Cas7/Cse4/CasC [Iodidimonas gelatinilytica]GEQ98233.1 type I-E CRISPR-associated protein Cas7/Cse4/CasC [Iodidimonas gelatinilytica]
MTSARFLQIHTLHSYTASLLNRDDSGLAKRLPFGGVMRTRISSQCLKRHWRMAKDDPHALANIAGVELDVRSRNIVEKRVLNSLRSSFENDLVDALSGPFQKAVYGDKGEDQSNRQPLLLGEPEITWLKDQASKIAQEAQGDAKQAKTLAEAWAKDYKKNTKAMRDQTKLPGGISAALFGRMITSDVEANIDAAIHVAHAFTVHPEESESDYFTVVDDLQGQDEEAGASHIGETELNSGLFYGYVVVDIPALVDNLGGDTDLAAKVIHNLVYLIAEISPGAKRGSTAPYGRADLMLVEAGNRQPRSLANAFQTPALPKLEDAIAKLQDHVKRLDETYATGEDRRALTLWNGELNMAERVSLENMAQWAAKQLNASSGD